MSIPESHLAQEAIAALVDGELPPGPARRAARHLSGCGQCRLAVQAQREAKEALHRCADVDVPGDLLSRLRAIPFTTDVPGAGGGGLGTVTAGPGQLTVSDASGSWAMPLDPPRPTPQERAHQARWLRRGVTGTLVGLGLGVTALALSLPGTTAVPDRTPPPSVAGPSSPDQRSEVVPPLVRSMRAGAPVAVPAGAPGRTP
ncbi:MAG TPA: anti-sigma factor [Geodermatophilus sp.]|nr:anti-sigma factor [Geodermatophilus sp.]